MASEIMLHSLEDRCKRSDWERRMFNSERERQRGHEATGGRRLHRQNWCGSILWKEIFFPFFVNACSSLPHHWREVLIVYPQEKRFAQQKVFVWRRAGLPGPFEKTDVFINWLNEATVLSLYFRDTEKQLACSKSQLSVTHVLRALGEKRKTLV